MRPHKLIGAGHLYVAWLAVLDTNSRKRVIIWQGVASPFLPSLQANVCKWGAESAGVDNTAPERTGGKLAMRY